MTLRVTPEEIVARSKSPLLAIAPWWKRCQLSHIATITNGGAFKSSLFNSDGKGLPLIRIRDVGKAETRTYYSGDYEDKFIINPGDLLIGMDGDFRISRWQGTQALLNQRVCKLEVIDRTLYNDSFLEYVVQPYLDEVNKFTSAVTVKHLSSRTVAELPIPLPSLTEQERIVAAIEEHFSRIDAAESTAQTALARLDTLRRTILTAAFSGHLVDQDPDDEPASVLLKRIAAERPQRRTRHAAQGTNQSPNSVSKRLPPTWKWATVNEVSHVVLGQSPPGSSYNDVGYGSPFFQGKAEFGSFYPEVSKWTTEPKKQASAGSVLVSVRAPVGPTNVAPFDCAIGRGLAALHPLGGISTEYLLWAMRHTDTMLAKQGTGSTFDAVTGAQLKAHYLPISPLAEQARIVAAIEEQFSRIDAAKASLERCLQRCKVLRRAVLATAFSGRLVEQDPSDEPASVLLERIAAEQPKRRTRRKSA